MATGSVHSQLTRLFLCSFVCLSCCLYKSKPSDDDVVKNSFAMETRAFMSRLSTTLGILLLLCIRPASSFHVSELRTARLVGLRVQAARTKSETVARIDVATLDGLNDCTSTNEARQVLEQSLPKNGEEGGRGSLYNSLFIPAGASERTISDAELAIQTKIRNKRYSIMELIELNGDSDADRASLSLVCVMVASVGLAIAANQSLPGPEILRFAVVLALSFSPLTFVGYGIATPEKLQKVLISLQRALFPVYRKRMLQHEAGHFLMGHLLGYPVQKYQANAVKNAVEFFPFNDPNAGRDRAAMLGFDVGTTTESYKSDQLPTEREAQDVPYFSRDGRGAEQLTEQSVFRNAKNYTKDAFLKLQSAYEPSNAWPYRGFDSMTLDKLAVVSVAGVCAELLAFGNAEGGYADFSQLRQIFNSANTDMDETAMENRMRYAIGYAMSQLRLHVGALDALAEAMERDSTVSECVVAIESCSNVGGLNIFGSDFDEQRRERFRSEDVGLLEQLALGRKNADVEEDRYVEGKGGGYKRSSLFSLSGDDPLYAALAVSLLFLVWASAGGLSL